MPLGDVAHYACGTAQLLQRPDMTKALDVWERLTGRRLVSKGVHAWIASRLQVRQLLVEPGCRGLVIKAEQAIIELVPVTATNTTVAIVRGRRIVVHSSADVVELLRGVETEPVEARARHPEQPAAPVAARRDRGGSADRRPGPAGRRRGP